MRRMRRRAGLRLFLGVGSFTLIPPTPMPEPTVSDLLQETMRHTQLAVNSMERLIAVSTLSGMKNPIRFRNKILRIRRSKAIPQRKKARLIAYGMKKFSLLCRLDDLQNSLQIFFNNLTSVAETKKISVSDIPFWRKEFYEVMSAIYVLDQESDEDMY